MAASKDQVTAIVLAAGHGKRLMPITQWIPKPLVPVDGTPILLTELHRLASFGIKRAVVVYGRPTAFIPDFLDGMDLNGLEVVYALQNEQRGTGDALLTGMNLISDSEYYLLMAGDTVYSEAHLEALWHRFSEGDIDGCLLLKELPFQHLSGSSVVVLNEDDTIHSMISKPSPGELQAYQSNLADASLHVHSRDLGDYLRTAELSRTNELEVTTALRDWIRDGARIGGVVGETPPHITNLQDFIVHNVPLGRQFVAVSEIESAVDGQDDADISGFIQSLEASDIPFVYKRLKRLAGQPMGSTKQARVLALISEIFRYQAAATAGRDKSRPYERQATAGRDKPRPYERQGNGQGGFELDAQLDRDLAELDVHEFIESLEPKLAGGDADPAVYHYLAVAYTRHANKFVADSVFEEALSRMPAAERPAGFKEKVVVKAPARLAFSSSQGSDISYIIEEKGAVILNCSIKVNGDYPGTVTIEKIPEHHVELVAEDFKARATIEHYDEIFGHTDQNDPLILLKAGLRFAGVINPDDAETLGDWLAQYDAGIRITVHCTVPKGSGLGCSAILAAGLARGLREFAGFSTPDKELLLRAYCCERYYGRSGYQDIIGGAVGGVKLIQADGLTALFAPRIQKLDLGPEEIEAISQNLVIFHTGTAHVDTPYLLTIPAKYFTRSSDYMYAYENGKQLTHAMAEALQENDWETMGHLINSYWNDREFFEEDVTPDFARKFREDLAPMSYGTALCGSGHGGYMMVVPRPGQRQAVLDYIAQSGVEESGILEFEVIHDGIELEAE